ncbi:heptosyltransferase-1 [Robbsia andropogonis]|uniref:lipopolysaccharide heptosyltransferase I n=1 Tax=Robbsia andropogonis TaxID=28092 RepID=UPI003D20E6B1
MTNPHRPRPKIAIVRVSSLGDVVHNMPVVADILRYRPDADIDWIVEESFTDLVQLVTGVRRVIPVALRRWRHAPLSSVTRQQYGMFKRAFREERYDVIIDCQGLIKTAWIASRGRGPVVGLGNRTDGAGYEWPARYFYKRSIAIERRTHVVERSRQLVAAALDMPAPTDDASDVDFGLDQHKGALALARLGLNLPVPYVVFVHASSRKDKQWPETEWIALGEALARRGASLVLPWGNEEEKACSERIASHFGDAALVPPKLALDAVVGLLDGAAAVVGVDTGLVHIAAALRRPTVELYNFSTAWRTGGYWSTNVVEIGAANRPPHLSDVKQALSRFGLL